MANKSVGLLTIAFGADLRGFDKAMKKAQRSIKKFGTSMKNTGQNLTRNLTLPLAAFAAASVKAFDTQAKAEIKLLTALKGREDIQQRLIAQAKELQTKTLFGDEETIAAQAMLATMGLEEQAIKELIPLVQDMATAKGMDLVGAADLVAKSVGSSTNALSRYGITITGAVGSQERLNTATQALNRAFGGQAEAIAKVGAGSLVQLKNQFGDLMEDIGEKLLPMIIKLGNKLKNLVESFTSLDSDTKDVIITVGILAASLGPLLLIAGQLTIAFAALFSPGGLILMGIIALGAGLVYIVDNFEALKERLSDWTWWKNALIQASQWVVEYSPLSLLIKGFNELLKFLGRTEITNPFETLSDELGDLKDDTVEYKTEFGSFGRAIENASNKAFEALKKLSKGFDFGGGKNKNLDNGQIPFLSAIDPQKLIGPLNQVGETITELTNKQKQFNAAMGMFENIMTSAMTSAAYSTEGFFKSFMNNLKIAIKQLLVQLAVIMAIKLLLGDATTVKAAFDLAKAKILDVPKMANGGLFTGASLALVGEGAGTSASNPEVVAPLDKLKGMINGGGSQQVEVYGRISGNDIFISNQRGSLNRQRSV
jgi:hypothetical protein